MIFIEAIFISIAPSLSQIFGICLSSFSTLEEKLILLVSFPRTGYASTSSYQSEQYCKFWVSFAENVCMYGIDSSRLLIGDALIWISVIGTPCTRIAFGFW